MAFELIAKAQKVPDLDAKERAVLIYLANCYNSVSKRCHPSVTTIAKNTGWSVRTVYNALAALKKKGHVTTLAKGYPGRPNMYDLHLPDTATSAHAASMHPLQSSPAPVAAQHLHHLHTNPKEKNQETETGEKTSGEPHSYANLNPTQQNTEKQTVTEETKAKEKSHTYSHPCELIDFDELKKQEKYAPLASLPTAKDSKLVTLWKQELSKRGLAPVVTAIDGKALSNFTKLVGFDNATLLMPVIVKNWSDFTWHCEKKAGAFKSPTEPSVTYLHKYAAKAMDFYNVKLKESLPPVPQEMKELN